MNVSDLEYLAKEKRRIESFLQSGQLNGLMGGLKGAAEYETLVDKKSMAVRGMRPQSVVHLLVIVFVFIGNALYFYHKKN